MVREPTKEEVIKALKLRISYWESTLAETGVLLSPSVRVIIERTRDDLKELLSIKDI